MDISGVGVKLVAQKKPKGLRETKQRAM